VSDGPPRERRSNDGLRRRRLRREELDLVWTIDRSEVIERTYSLQDGELVLRADPFDMRGWPPGEAAHARPWLEASFDRGARFLGIFDADRLVAVGVLDTVFIGPHRDLLQLSFLHVGHDERGRGLGVELFDELAREARTLGAKGLYVSATPSEHTIDFYRRRGCRVIDVPDPELYAREPEDIHLECRFAEAPSA
jgi:predicted N-acetyltransferase YhbS